MPHLKLCEPQRPRLLMVGASARAAAWSAVRAGWYPVCFDRFSDLDLQQVAEVLPRKPAQQDERFLAPVVPTVAYLLLSEQHPWWTAETAAEPSAASPRCGVRWGCAPQAFLELTPWRVAEILGRRGYPFLETWVEPRSLERWLSRRCRNLAESPQTLCYHPQQQAPPSDGTWLQKPLASGGGRRIRFWTPAAQAQPWDEPAYFQRFQPGEPYSAVFVAHADKLELVGITQQLIGVPQAAPPWPFSYCGNVGPVPLPAPAVALLQQQAEAFVAESSGLRGLFGIDFVWDGTTPWITELNLRYTASCEILELALRRPLLSDHWRACFPAGSPPPPPWPVTPRCGAQPPVLGKLILYAATPVVTPEMSRFLQHRSPWTVPYVADVPAAGTVIQPGQPICTVFASGLTSTECRVKLWRRAAWWRARLQPLTRGG